jgi:hypothetical protein
MNSTFRRAALLASAALTFALTFAWQLGQPLRAEGEPQAATAQPTLNSQSQADVDRKSAGCLSCHQPDAASMHAEAVRAGCTDCHGGDASAMRPATIAVGTTHFRQIQQAAHVRPRLTLWRTSANPPTQWYETLAESAEFIRFVNPGDLRVADLTCGQCHAEEVRHVSKSMMRHGGMLWGAALYNNGSFPFKDTQFGEFYIRRRNRRRSRHRKPACCRRWARSIRGRCRSRAMSCACSSAAAAGRSKLAAPTRMKNPAGRRIA